MSKTWVAGVVICLLTTSVAASPEVDTPRQEELEIADVMVEAHMDGLLQKVLDGEASKEEKDRLLDLYIYLIENEPPRGEQTDWLMRSGRAVVAAARVSVGRENALEELEAATNCKACHDVHK